MIEEFIHEYRGYNIHPSKCQVRIYTDDGETMICFIDLGVGTSVTNCSEQLAQEIVNKHNLRPQDCRFFETYEQYEFDTFDEIEYEWTLDQDHWEAKSPKWKPVSDDKIKNLFTDA
jgi:hypothetical protein